MERGQNESFLKMMFLWKYHVYMFVKWNDLEIPLRNGFWNSWEFLGFS